MKEKEKQKSEEKNDKTDKEIPIEEEQDDEEYIPYLVDLKMFLSTLPEKNKLK